MTTEVAVSAASLREKKCRPCEGGVEPLREHECHELMAGLDKDWRLSDDLVYLQREIDFPGYARTVAFVNAVAWIANVEGHHPDIRFGYGNCTVVWMTHAINGLSVNDFICAAKTDQLLTSLD